jgi:mannosyltransferase
VTRVREQRILAGIAVLFAVLAWAVAVTGSWIPSFWGDEATSIMSAQRPLPTLFAMLGNVDAVHGTYYLLLHFWVDVFGASPLSVRFPSAIATGVSAAGVVYLAQRLAGLRPAVYAGAIAVFLPRLTVAGMEARSFALSAACVVWLTYILVVLLQRGDRRFLPWLGYATLFAASVYVFAYSVLVGLAHGLIVICSARGKRIRKPWFFAAGAGVLAATPVLVWGYLEREQIAFLARRIAADWAPVLIGQWFGNLTYAALMWGVLLVALAVWLVRRIRRQRRSSASGGVWSLLRGIPDAAMVPALVAFVPPAVLLTINIFVADYSNRYLAMCAPAVAVLVGYFISRLGPRPAIALLLFITIAALPTYVQQRTPFAKNESDWKQVAAIVQAHAREGDGIVFDESTRPSLRLRLAMHTYPAAFSAVDDLTVNVPYAKNNWWWDKTYKVGTVAHRFAGVKRVWLLEYRLPGRAPDTYAMQDLRGLGYNVTASYSCHRSVVYELTR